MLRSIRENSVTAQRAHSIGDWRGTEFLSAQGAWLDSDANWPAETVPGFTLAEWRHIATMGRDQYVKTVNLGDLLPFGHLAEVVKVTERKINPVPTGSLAGKPAAYLRQREFIIVRQPVVAYPDAAPQPTVTQSPSVPIWVGVGRGLKSPVPRFPAALSPQQNNCPPRTPQP